MGLVAAFTGGTLGWCIGGVFHATLVPQWSPAMCAATMAVALAAVAALFVRPAVAVGFGLAGTIVGLLLGGLLVERGIAPTAPLAGGESPSAVEPSPSASLRQARSGLSAAMLDILSDAQASAKQANANRSDAISTLAGTGARAYTQLRSRWELMPEATRTFLLAVSAAGAAVGFGLGVVFSRWALAGASSVAGSILVLGCGWPLAESFSPALRCSDSAAAWLLLGSAVALSGWAFQMRRVEKRDHPQPKATS